MQYIAVGLDQIWRINCSTFPETKCCTCFFSFFSSRKGLQVYCVSCSYLCIKIIIYIYIDRPLILQLLKLGIQSCNVNWQTMKKTILICKNKKTLWEVWKMCHKRRYISLIQWVISIATWVHKRGSLIGWTGGCFHYAIQEGINVDAHLGWFLELFAVASVWFGWVRFHRKSILRFLGLDFLPHSSILMATGHPSDGFILGGGCLEVWLLLVLNRLGWPLHLLSEWGRQGNQMTQVTWCTSRICQVGTRCGPDRCNQKTGNN